MYVQLNNFTSIKSNLMEIAYNKYEKFNLALSSIGVFADQIYNSINSNINLVNKKVTKFDDVKLLGSFDNSDLALKSSKDNTIIDFQLNDSSYSSCLIQKVKNLEMTDVWFNSNLLRKIFFEKTIKDIPYDNRQEIIWMICHYTALVIFSLVAPLKSYEKHIDKIVEMTSRDRMSCGDLVHPQFTQLCKDLREELNHDEGKAFICNLNNNLHSFVIEKRENVFYLYQSYFGCMNTKGYNFIDFLEDSSKSRVWTYEELIDKLAIIFGEKESTWEGQKDAYFALFHVSNDNFIPYSFSFVPTDPYRLAQIDT